MHTKPQRPMAVPPGTRPRVVARPRGVVRPQPLGMQQMGSAVFFQLRQAMQELTQPEH